MTRLNIVVSEGAANINYFIYRTSASQHGKTNITYLLAYCSFF